MQEQTETDNMSEDFNEEAWLKTLRESIKNEDSVELNEFEELLELAEGLKDNPEAQEKATALLDEFNAKAHEVTEAVFADKQHVEFDDRDWAYFKKMMRKAPWNGEEMELLLKAYQFVEDAHREARSRDDKDSIYMVGKEIYGVIEQFNRIEGQGIDRARKFFQLYEKFATAFIRFKEIKERNDRVLQRYESELQEELQKVTAAQNGPADDGLTLVDEEVEVEVETIAEDEEE